MWFDQAEAKDLTLLAEYGVWGGVPAAPLCLPGLGRYGRYQFDRYVLLQRNNLTVAQRREVIFLAEHFHKIDHFEFFELSHDADERSLKRAFFRFSKRFHPDQVSAIDLGHFSEHVQMVFEYGQQAYKLLTEEREFRAAYARVTAARDHAYLTHLKTEREVQRSRVESARAKGIKPPLKSRIASAPTPATDQRTQEEITDRKAMLRERLAKNNQRRQDNAEAKHSADLKSQAKTFFIAGEQAERRGQLNRALNHFKLCVEYIPQEKKYMIALKRVEALISDQRASGLWSEVEVMLSADDELQRLAAIDLMVEACEISPNQRRLMTLSQETIELDCVDRALPLLIKQHKKEELSLEYMWAIVQCYEALKQIQEAKHYAHLMISLDPSEPRAIRFNKRYH